MALPPLAIPDPFSAADWATRSRELVDEFARVEYGVTPPGGRVARVTAVPGRDDALDIVMAGPLGELTVPALLRLPPGASTEHPAPFVIALSFTSIDSTDWPFDLIARAGFAVLAADYRDIEADDPAGDPRGARSLFPQTDDAPAWGALGAWAWGFSRLLDAADGIPGVDASRAVALGHSRIGKAAVWAGAQDPRFAVTVSNGSGCGGASLFRHREGEDVAAITSSFPHWFTPSFAGYADREDDLPVDQHQLLAAIAPRRVYVASAIDDAWADPIGEQLAVIAAAPAFAAFGFAPGDGIAAHLRSGQHELSEHDWMHALAFSARALRGPTP